MEQEKKKRLTAKDIDAFFKENEYREIDRTKYEDNTVKNDPRIKVYRKGRFTIIVLPHMNPVLHILVVAVVESTVKENYWSYYIQKWKPGINIDTRYYILDAYLREKGFK